MKEKLRVLIGAIMLVVLVAFTFVINYLLTRKDESNLIVNLNPELQRAMTYELFEDGDEDIEGTDNVKFSAFFLRDVDGDGYAEKVKGTCKEIGKKDTLYMEINVQTEGYLKDGKMEIDGKNFLLDTVIPKDTEIKKNCIETDTKEILFNNLPSGIHKTIIGSVKCGVGDYNSANINQALRNNINNYSINDNKIVLTGTYVNQAGTEIPVRKEIELSVDWYGFTKTRIESDVLNYELADCINLENNTLETTITMTTKETNNELIISAYHMEGILPEINGYAPISVKSTDDLGTFFYDESTRKFTIDRATTTRDNGEVQNSIKRNNLGRVRVVYSLDALESLDQGFDLKIPFSANYEGYNNPNDEFENPHISQESKILTLRYYIDTPVVYSTHVQTKIGTGRSIDNPVSKLKPLSLYYGNSSEVTDDTYVVEWCLSYGSNEEKKETIIKETKDGENLNSDVFVDSNGEEYSLEDITTNIGMYFDVSEELENSDGEIKIYDDETGTLIHTFIARDSKKYSFGNPYMFDNKVKHIRVVTDILEPRKSIRLYFIKELDDEKINQQFTLAEFEEMKYIKTHVEAYIGNIHKSDFASAPYNEPLSHASIVITNNVFSTQVTSENKEITLYTRTEGNKLLWRNGTFLLEFPEEIIDVKVNDISTSNDNVNIVSYETIKEGNNIFIKIRTSNDEPESFSINLNADITPDPRGGTVTTYAILYSINEEYGSYYNKTKDIYDIDSDGDTEEFSCLTRYEMKMVSPNSLLTSQTISDYNDQNEIAISPEIAFLDPINEDDNIEYRTAKISAQINNNYSNKVSEIKILGKIPFEGNTYTLKGSSLNSKFSTTMTSDGITIPDSLNGKISVYYSYKENPTKDLDDLDNEWVSSEDVDDWSKVKCWLVDMEDTVLNRGDEYTFSYVVQVPKDIDYNVISYSHHGVYFSLNTEEGKFRTQTEPNKVGLEYKSRYSIKINKYQKDSTKLIPGAIYKISRLDENENEEESQTAVTGIDGSAEVTNLFTDKTYEIKEIQSPADYELNSDVIRIIGNLDRTDGSVEVEKISGTTKGEIVTTKPEGELYKGTINVEDDVKAKLKITKYEKGTSEKINNVKYKITGAGLRNSGAFLTTNTNGEINIKGLKLDEEYTIEEVKAEGYYLNEPIVLKVVNNSGIYSYSIIEGTVKSSNLTTIDELPIVNIDVEDEKIPTFDLQINKIEKGTGVDGIPAVPVVGAKFKLYNQNKEIGSYETDIDGHININGLYQFNDFLGGVATYTLKETYAPEGYAKIKDITFIVREIDDSLTLLSLTNTNYTVDGTTINLVIEDSPSFRLIKKDGETNQLLPNVKFAIYNIDDERKPATNCKGEIIGTKEIINGREYYVVETNENGEIIADLPEGIYEAVEVEADDKYDFLGKRELFGIGESRQAKQIYAAEWEISIGGSANDYINCITKTADGGFIIAGRFDSDNLEIGGDEYERIGTRDLFIAKYDDQQNVEWVETIGGGAFDEITSIYQTNDRGYIVGGNFKSAEITIGDRTYINAGTDTTDGFIIKFNEYGEIEWSTTIGAERDDKITDVSQKLNGNYMITGFYYSSKITIESFELTNNNTYTDSMILEYNSNGQIIWANSIGGTSGDSLNAICGTDDGGYLIGGDTYSYQIRIGDRLYYGSSKRSGLIIKHNSNNEVEWVKVLSSTQDGVYINDICETQDGGGIAVGQYRGSMTIAGKTLPSTNYGGALAVKFDHEGELEWGAGVDGDAADTFYSVSETPEGNYIVGGLSNSSILAFEDNSIVCQRQAQIAIKISKEGVVKKGFGTGGRTSSEIGRVIAVSEEEILMAGSSSEWYLGTGETETFNRNRQNSSEGLIKKYREIDNVDIRCTDATTIGGVYNERIKEIISTKDEGYIVAYNTEQGVEIREPSQIDSGHKDDKIVKYNKNGEEEWSYYTGETSFDSIQGLCETSDGGFIEIIDFVGYNIRIEDTVINNPTPGFDQSVIIKYSNNGEVEWFEPVIDYAWGGINDVCATSDGGFVIVKSIRSSSVTIGDTTITNEYGEFDSGLIIKCNQNGEVEWSQLIGKNIEYNKYEWIRLDSICELDDGDLVVVGKFSGKSISIGNYSFETSEDYMNVGIIARYSSNGEIEWATKIDGEVSFEDICKTRDGGFAVVGAFSGERINIENSTIINKGKENGDGFIIKFDKFGNCEWAKGVGNNNYDYLNCISETSDGGLIVGGGFRSDYIIIGGRILYNTNSTSFQYSGYCNEDCLIIKYDNKGNVEWTQKIGDWGSESVGSICELSTGELIIGSYFTGSTFSIDDYTFNHAEQNTFNMADAILLKIMEMKGVEEQEEITIENYRKEFKITTDIKEKDGVKGGTISGEDELPYETVKYGDDSEKPIIIKPIDNSYGIMDIKVNGEEIEFDILDDGSYIIPQFNNVTENKNITVSFAKWNNVFTINKVDEETGERLEGAWFRLDQIDERNDPDEDLIVGNLVGNGEPTLVTLPDKTNEVEDVIGEVDAAGEFCFLRDGEGNLVPTNGKTWADTNNIPEEERPYFTVANSIVRIDLTGLSGNYMIGVTARVSSAPEKGWGYATVNTNDTAPSYYNSNGRFMYISGEKDYEEYISKPIEGGSLYYLHLGYREYYEEEGIGEDQVVIKDIKLYPTQDVYETYNFVEEDGVIKSSNQGIDNTTCNSYIPIDLTGYVGKYYVSVDARVSADDDGDFGYIAVTENTDVVPYNNYEDTTRIYNSDYGDDDDSYNQVYSIEVEGGKQYYLHLGYHKNESNSRRDDTFTIRDINIELSPSDLYHSEIIATNSNGQAITSIPFGKYAINEIKAPNNYEIINPSTIINFVHGEGEITEYTISNRKIGNVIVHHYKKGTTEKIAEDEILKGSQGTAYSTLPKTNMTKYRLEEENDDYVLPDNRTGIFTYNDVEVNYYYVPKEIPLTVHYYIEGTMDGVPLSNGDVAEDINLEGYDGEIYNTEAVDISLLDPKYELVGEPDNKDGIYEYDEIVVTYNYRVKDSLGYVVHHVNKESGEKIAEDEVVSGGKYGDSYTTNPSSEIPPNYSYDSRSDNWEGILVDTLTEVTYYYKSTTELKTLDVNKTSTTNLVNDKNQVVDYRITYSGTIDEYIGKAKIRIIDNLPYEIDESLSNLNGGTYDRTNKTITWEDSYAGINTYENGPYNITLNKNISLVYKNIDLTAEEMTNNISGNLITYNGDTEHERIATKELDIPQEIKGKVVVKYLDKKTNEEIEEVVEHSARIGTDYDVSSDIKTIDGYELVEEPQEKTGIYTEADQEKVYKYTKKISYTVEYYYNNVKDETKTETKEGLEETVVENYTNKVIDGYKLDREEGLPLTLDRDGNNVIKIYYVKDSFGYRVEYYYDNVIDDSKTEVKSAEFGSTINTYEDKVIDGYKLDDEENLPLTITSDSNNNVIRIYYVKDNFDYTIEYYYDGEKDDSKTEVKSAEFGSIINTHDNKNIDGYKLDRTDNLPLTISSDEDNNIIKVYYIKDNFNYTIEYYYDEVRDDSKTEVKSAVFGSIINTYDDKVIDGYKLDDEENLPLTITSNSNNNVIRIYYVKDEFDYTVEYYFNGIKDDSLTETDTAEFGSRIEDYIDKVKPGYIYSRSENLPLIITSNSDNNKIKIYYILDDGQTKQLFYKIEYYKDEELQEDDTKRITNTVQLLDPDTIEVNSVEVLEQDKYEGYVIDRTEPEDLPNVINSGSTIKVFFKKRNDITYKILYKEKGTGREISEAENGVGTYQEIIKAEDNIKDINGYVYDSYDKERITLSENETQNVITIFYKKRNDLSYIVQYLEKDTNVELKTAKVVNNQTYQDEILSEDEVVDINGYEYDSSNINTLIISDDVSLNNIKLCYKKRSDLSYVVKYVDKDTNKEIAERKTVNNRTYGEVIDASSEVIDIAKYNYDSISSDTITIETDNNEVIVYYTKKEGTIIVKYIDQSTGETIKDSTSESGKVDDNYSVREVNINGYVYIESSGNKEGTYTENTQEVILYYRKAAKVIVKYVDKNTNEPIENDVVISGFIGKEYNLEDKGKEIRGYVYSERTDNISGQMTEEDTEVIYYYKKESKVIVKYINSYTNEVIETEEKTYVEGDTYTSTIKDIEGFDADEDKKPENTTGTIGREDLEIKYYYKEKATLVVEYVDEKDNKIVNDKETSVHIGDAYEVDKVLIDGYNFRGMPDNYKGTIENKNTVVRLVYDKIYSDDSKADTTIPKTMDKNMRKVYIISGMVAVSIYSISVIIRWKNSEKKNK